MTVMSMLDTSDQPIPLPAGFLACCQCGSAVKRKASSAVVSVEAMSREGEPPPSPGSNRQAALRAEFTRCRPCADRRELAVRILASHPKIAMKIGDAAALHRLSSALDAIAVLDRPVPTDPTNRAVDETTVTSWITRLAAAGAAARWEAKFAPVLLHGADPTRCNPSPWAHVHPDGDLRRELRLQFALTLSDRLARSAPMVALPAPDGSVGCLFCGVDKVLMPAAQVQSLGGKENATRAAWTSITVDPSAIGGRRSPDRLDGHLCPDCAQAVDQVGSIGLTAMTRALGAYLSRAHRDREAALLQTTDDPRLVGWAVADRRPNRVPWGHLRLTV